MMNKEILHREKVSLMLKEGERLDDLQLEGLYIIQDDEHFSFGVDAVFLSDFANVKRDEKVLDLGTGTGILPILLSAKTKASHLVGLEIQEESIDMARRSVAYNNLEGKIDIIKGDIKEAGKIFGSGSFEVIVSNPPYMIVGHGLANVNESKYIARHEALVSLEELLREVSSILNEKGRFYMVHRPFRLAEIFAKMKKYKLEPKRMKLIYPYIDSEPKLVLVEGLKGGNSGTKIEAPIVMYERGKR